MADSISLSSNFMCYWDNTPYNYTTAAITQINNATTVNTGWHVLPNILWKHFLSPRQWYEMCIKYEAYHVEGYTSTLYNAIPLTQNLAIQGTSTFTAFNNTIYSLGAQDTLYETSYHNWWKDPIWKDFFVAYKEGLIISGSSEASQQHRALLPKYLWEIPDTDPYDPYTWCWDPVAPEYPPSYTTWPHTNQGNQITRPSGIFWDPLTDPDSIMELRPGKNSMSFHWNNHNCDDHIWYNLDSMAKLLPYVPEGPWLGTLSQDDTESRYGKEGTYIPNQDYTDPFPQTSYTTAGKQTTKPTPYYKGRYQDYSIPNLLNLPIVPIKWFWVEINKNMIENTDPNKPQLGWPGTEYESYKYGPTQCFIKGVPLFNEQNTLIQTSTQGVLRNTIHLKLKKRRSRYFGPTWGPMSWEMTSTIAAPFVLPTTRYRTGGARRGWQNYAGLPTSTSQNNPQRWDPYTTSTYTSSATTTTYTYSNSQS